MTTEIDRYIPEERAAFCGSCRVYFWNRRGKCPACDSDAAVEMPGKNGKKNGKKDEVAGEPMRDHWQMGHAASCPSSYPEMSGSLRVPVCTCKKVVPRGADVEP
jgi:hypothetical protein